LLFPTGRQTNRATRAATAAGKQQQGGGESPLGLVHLVNISEKLAKYFKRCMFVLRLSTPTSPPFWGLGDSGEYDGGSAVEDGTSFAKFSVRVHFIYL